MALRFAPASILGINARNFDYIAKYNPRESKRFADDKIFTKQFLEARNVGVARLYATVRTLAQLRAFNPTTLPQRFVIKPNHGFGGEGILVVTDSKANKYTTTAGTRYAWKDIFRHCVGILDGRYALSGLRDTVLFEELLEPHTFFSTFLQSGLPDIRVIIFRRVPVMAMLRLPTTESHGKANVHLGAIGIGLDIGTGRAVNAVRRNRFVKRLPNGDPLRQLRVPQWDEILLTAAKIQHHTTVGYLAADLALTTSGIKVLELNARAGLEIQNCNRRGLRADLEKLNSISVHSPEEGVRVAKTLFARAGREEVVRPKKQKPTIGSSVIVQVANAKNRTITAKVDLHGSTNQLDERITLPEDEKLLRLRIKEHTLTVPFRYQDLSHEPYDLVLSGKYLSDFYIDVAETQPDLRAQRADEKMLQNIDRKLASIDERIHLLARVKPVNLDVAEEKFLKNPTTSPVFTYTRNDDEILALRKELRKIPKELSHPLAPLVLAKANEIEEKVATISAVGSSEFPQRSERLYGKVESDEFELAVRSLRTQPVLKDTSDVLSVKKVRSLVLQHLRRLKLTEWKVVILEQATTDMQVNKRHTILIAKKAQISEHRMRALLAHELETHVFRLENGQRQPYRLFRQGTAGYLFTEEGLAIYNQKRLGIPLGEKNLMPAFLTIGIHLATRGSFADVYRVLTENYGLGHGLAWKICVKVKRGMGDTAAPGAFSKDRVYFTGYREVEDFLKKRRAVGYRKLYLGKIAVRDVPHLDPSLFTEPKYLPAISWK